MSNSLLAYNEYQDILNRDSEILPKKEELEQGGEKEDLISDNNYGDDDYYYNNNNIRSSNSTLCIIDECSDLGANLIAITDSSENYFPYFVCDKHYHELMIGYYFKETKEKKKNNNAMIINNQVQ